MKKLATDILLVLILCCLILLVPVTAAVNGKIAFSSNRDGNWEIYVMNADGTNQTCLTTNSVDDFQPSWSPDGLKIVYPCEGYICVMNPDGSGQTEIWFSNDYNPDWSPDEKKIITDSYRDSVRPDIYMMDADGI